MSFAQIVVEYLVRLQDKNPEKKKKKTKHLYPNGFPRGSRDEQLQHDTPQMGEFSSVSLSEILKQGTIKARSSTKGLERYPHQHLVCFVEFDRSLCCFEHPPGPCSDRRRLGSKPIHPPYSQKLRHSTINSQGYMFINLNRAKHKSFPWGALGSLRGAGCSTRSHASLFS